MTFFSRPGWSYDHPDSNLEPPVLATQIWALVSTVRTL